MNSIKLTAIVLTATLLLPFAITLLPEAPAALLDPLGMWPQEQASFPAPQGHPDRFFQYHRDIRASKDGVDGYSVGYRVKEFEKALAAAKTSSSKLNWVERGPGNVGGRTRAILVDPDDPGLETWWAGSVSGGLWKTVDGGNNWKPQTEFLPILAVTCLAMAESNPDVIYMGTGEGTAGAGAVKGDGIFKSTDRGETWIHLTATTSGDGFSYVNRLAVDPSNPNVVLAATNRGIFRTTDGGESWAQVWGQHPENGLVQDLRAQPGNFDVQIAAVKDQGILYTANAGSAWAFASLDQLEQVRRIELAFSPSHPSIAYAAAEGPIRAQLYRTDDGGMNWAPTTEPTGLNWLGGQGWFDNTIAVHPFKPDTVFVGGINLWRTILSGAKTTVGIPGELDYGGSDSWLEFFNFSGSAFGGRASYLDFYAVDVAVADYSNIEIRFGQGTQMAHRFWVSETAGFYGNGGADVLLSEYIYADYVEVPFQVWDVDNGRQLMVSFRDQAEDGEFNLIEYYRTSDPGTRDLQSFEFIFVHKYDYSDAAPHGSIATSGGVPNGMLYYLLPVLASGATWDSSNLPSQSVSLGFRQVDSYIRSIDNGIDANRSIHVDNHGLFPIAIDKAQNEFWVLVANDGGVAVSKNNGTSFRETDRAFAGYNTSQVYGVAKQPGSPIYTAGFQDNGTYLSFNAPNSGRGWRSAIGADGIETVWHATDKNLVLGTTQYSAVLRSANGGTSWTQVQPYDVANGIFVSSIDSGDLAPDDVYNAKRDGVWISRNFGLTWTLNPIQDNWGPWDGCKVRVSIANPDVVWAGCGMSAATGGAQRLHVSKDKAVSFDLAALPTFSRAPSGAISGLATHPVNAGTAYALFSLPHAPKILETQDYGQNWTDLTGFESPASSNGFPDVAVYDLVVMPQAAHVLWAGTEIGIFVSKSSGIEWNYANNGLPAVSVWRMKIRDDELLVGTHGRGVWTVPLSEIDVAKEEIVHEIPSGLSLSQNYPNPFNASTTIEFAVHQESRLRLVVFDVTGRRISELTDRVYAPGVHRLHWNANAFPSGVYLYGLEANGRLIHARKMTLVK